MFLPLQTVLCAATLPAEPMSVWRESSRASLSVYVLYTHTDTVHGGPDAGSGEHTQMDECVFGFVCARGEQQEAGLGWTA